MTDPIGTETPPQATKPRPIVPVGTREHRVFQEIKKLASYDMVREIAVLKKKLRLLEESRGEWREKALRYQKELIEGRTEWKKWKGS